MGKIFSLCLRDAVAKCAQLAGIIDEKRCNYLSGLHFRMIGIYDRPVESATDMLNLPSGHILVFFAWEENEGRCAHAMISVGEGKAAGNKNDRIGKGLPVSWEVLDFALQLTWTFSTGFGPDNIISGYVSQTIGRTRHLYVRSREVNRLRDSL